MSLIKYFMENIAIDYLLKLLETTPKMSLQKNIHHSNYKVFSSLRQKRIRSVIGNERIKIIIVVKLIFIKFKFLNQYFKSDYETNNSFQYSFCRDIQRELAKGNSCKNMVWV